MDNTDKYIEEINQKFSSEHWLDFEIYSYKDEILKIKASVDFTYSHSMEIYFFEPLYFHGATSWTCCPNKGVFMKLLDENTKISLSSIYGNNIPKYAFEFSTDRSAKVTIFSNDIKVNFDTVYYYLRENLLDGERLDESLVIKR